MSFNTPGLLLNQRELLHKMAKKVGHLSIATLASLTPVTVMAHDGAQSLSHSFASGLAHPVTGLDHLLVILSVGMLALTVKSTRKWQLPLTFLVLFLASVAIGMSGAVFGSMELLLAASVAISGYLLLRKHSINHSVLMVLVALFAGLHGYAHGVEVPATASSLNYIAGLLSSSAMLLVAGYVGGKHLLNKKLVASLVGVSMMAAGMVMIAV